MRALNLPCLTLLRSTKLTKKPVLYLFDSFFTPNFSFLFCLGWVYFARKEA